MNSKLKIILKKVLLLLLFSMILLGIGTAFGFLISYKTRYNLQDTLGIEGILLVVIGIMLSMKGSSSGASISGIGQDNADYISLDNLQTTRLERDISGYNENFFEQHVNKFRISNLSVILGGIFIAILSFLVK